MIDPRSLQRHASDPKASVWVAASAGTGKTKVLTDRVLSILLAGTPPHRLLCLTFTKAAAAEMANRIARRLSIWATASEIDLSEDIAALLGKAPDPATLTLARRLFTVFLETPGGMKIQTIHGFCQSLLGRFPLEAGLAPHFQVMDEQDAQEIMASAREEVLAGIHPDHAAALEFVTAHIHETAFPSLMADLSAERGRLKAMIAGAGGLEAMIARLYAHMGLEFGQTREDLIEAACRDEAFDVARCRLAIGALAQGSKTDCDRADTIAAWLAASPAERVKSFDSYLLAFFTKQYERRAKLATKSALAAMPDLETILTQEAERLSMALDRLNALFIAQGTAAILTLGQALIEAYQHHKERRAVLDYDDLILAARQLLATPDYASWVLFKLDGGIDHILVDEAQDTNPDQWAVIEALTAEFFSGHGQRAGGRTIFAVGDAKQSIYSFQRADPRAFSAMRGLFAEKIAQGGEIWREVGLNVSFRSTKAVLRVVDAVLAGQGGRGVVPAGLERAPHHAWRAEDGGLVELWPLIEPDILDEREAWKPPIERVDAVSASARAARLVAEKIAAMIGAQENLASKGRPIRAGDIMVLVRRRGAFVPDLVRALKALDIPVAGADRLVLTQDIAVMDLMALGQVLLLPEDDLTLAAVLKSPLIGLTEEALFDLAHHRPDGTSLWSALRQRGSEPSFSFAWSFLSDLLGRVDYVTPYDFYADILTSTQGTSQTGKQRLLTRLGIEAEDALDEFIALALAYERGHAPSLQGFLAWLESGAVEIKRDLDQSSIDAVRIMTVHGAKGLQAPIVFLPDTTQIPTASSSFLWLEHADLVLWPPPRSKRDAISEEAYKRRKQAQEDEYRRLLYVAMTRAEDRLYVLGWKTPKRPVGESSWYSLIEEAMRKEGEEVEDLVLAHAREDGKTTLLRVSSPQIRPIASYKPVSSDWDESKDLPPWARCSPPPEPSPPRPLIPSYRQEQESAVLSPLTAEEPRNPYVKGRLIHRLLQSLPDMPPERWQATMSGYLSQSCWALSASEQSQMMRQIESILTAPDLAPLFAAGSQAEVSIAGMVGERILSGRIDRLRVTDTEIILVDYKTGRHPPASQTEIPESYRRQMAAYRAALTQIYPDRPIQCYLIWTNGPVVMKVE